MTDKTQPAALRLAEWCDANSAGIYRESAEAAAELRRQHARIAELEAEESRVKLLAECRDAFPIPEPGSPLEVQWAAAMARPEEVPDYVRLCVAAMQAATKAAPGDMLDEALRERDDAEDFIDALLDEVLGHERPEWSSSYGRADALDDVQERMTALHKPAVDKAWGRFQSAMAAPQQEAQEPCPTCVALARTVMLDQVSFDRKPDCYGIRQITDDESVEEWEDIRTSPDVAREEANDMMATGRGELYEVVPLWTTPQPSLTAKAAGSVLEDAARLDWLALAGPVSICVVIDRPHDGEVEVSTDDVTGYGKTLREAIDAVIAAQGGKDA